jgi:hypothetical protein
LLIEKRLAKMDMHFILNILIGLLLVWVITSLIVVGLHELLSAKFKWRAKMLEMSIRNMLSDSALADQLYNHPLVRSLYSGEDGTSKPSYIPASQFAQALMDMIVSYSSEAALIQYYLYKLRWELLRLDKTQQPDAQKRINLLLALTRHVLASQSNESPDVSGLDEIREGLVSLGDDYPELKPVIESMMTTITIQQTKIRDAIELAGKNNDSEYPIAANRYKMGMIALGIAHPRLKQVLGALLSELNRANFESENVLLRARQNIEDWFNNSMDRLSGWYRRRTQTLLYAIAIGLAFFFNIDSVHLATFLWKDSVTSELLTLISQRLVLENPDGLLLEQTEAIGELIGDVIHANLPLGWVGLPVTSSAEGVCATFNDTHRHLLLFGQCYPLTNVPAPSLGAWFAKIFGLLITGIAAAQGAPFWFDILKKLINVRMSGANPIELKRAVG